MSKPRKIKKSKWIARIDTRPYHKQPGYICSPRTAMLKFLLSNPNMITTEFNRRKPGLPTWEQESDGLMASIIKNPIVKINMSGTSPNDFLGMLAVLVNVPRQHGYSLVDVQYDSELTFESGKKEENFRYSKAILTYKNVQTPKNPMPPLRRNRRSGA